MTQPFDDERVRRALAHAIDRDAIIDQVLLGRATKIDGILSPDAFGKNESLSSHDFDMDTARSLMREAGYAEGFRVRLHTSPLLEDTAAAMVPRFAALGLEVKVEILEPGSDRGRWPHGLEAVTVGHSAGIHEQPDAFRQGPEAGVIE